MPIQYTVEQGDCLSSIADEYGFLWSTIWNYGENAQLKEERKDPNALLPGDVVVIPDKQLREESRSSGAKYKFKKKGGAKVKIRVMTGGKPRANEPYKLLVDGTWYTGKLDKDGYLKQKIPAGAQSGLLKVGSGKQIDEFPIQLGTVDPLSTESGVAGRLRTMGYRFNDGNMYNALKAFQKKVGLEETGELNEDTRNMLQERFGQ
ncbi:MAG TPA: peptidoglycan-binding protein [Phycisphaerae bacterium]|nr:peptidoglycan-binding protein [Phycisphaerae bacterium]